MDSLQDRIKVAPLRKVGLGYGAFFGLLLGAPTLVLLLSVDTPPRAWLLLLPVVALPVFIVAAVAAERRAEHRITGPRSRDERLRIARALRTGEPPDDPALDGPLLGLAERQKRLQRRWLPLWLPLAVLLLVLSVAGILLDAWNTGGLGGLVGGLLASGAVLLRQRAARRRLEPRIRERSGHSAPSG